MPKILISGGHLTPALAIIDQARLEKRRTTFIFMGREFSQDNSKQTSHEKNEIQRRRIVFIPTVAPKFHKTYWWRNVFELPKVIPSLLNAWTVTSEHKPDLFLTFGGYLAFPIALVCRLRQIPIITHEQTVTAGLANHVISFLSTKVAISHESSQSLFPTEKTVLTGNPIRPHLFYTKVPRPDWIKRSPSKPLLYITGGNQGSEVLNSTVEQTLSTLSSKWFVVHQCGNPTKTQNYESRLLQASKNLPKSQRSNYVVKTWINETELTWILKHAQLAVSRSGANTIQELIVYEVPSILVPLPFSHRKEQQKNAEIIENAGCAKILPQRNLSPESFLSTLEDVAKKAEKMKENAGLLKATMKLDGATALLDLIDIVLQHDTYLTQQEVGSIS